jgi:hypothetical protein
MKTNFTSLGDFPLTADDRAAVDQNDPLDRGVRTLHRHAQAGTETHQII